MSSNSYVGPPNQKRFRPDNESYMDSNSSENHESYPKNHKYPTADIFETFETRQFDGLKHSDHCVVVEGRDSGRHLFSSPPYATAAVTNTSDTELLSNGDSGFQELNIPDELTILEKTIKNNKIDNDETVNEPQSETEKIKTSLVVENQSTSKDSQDDDSISEFSYASDLSNLSGEDWKPINNNIEWIQRQIENGTDPKEIIQHLTGGEIITDIDDICAWRLLIRMLSEPSVRTKLDTVNNIDDVIKLIQKSSKIIVLTGAGVSVSCGIPDFRSRNGIYARLSKDYPDLPDPQSMFDIHYFKRNPYPFFKFAKEIYPGQFQPSPSHKFIKYIEMREKLLRNYSQNIDTLEKTAGIENVITCHGSFATATCTLCGFKVDSNAIKSEIFAQKIPLCPQCTLNHATNTDDNQMLPVMKPDIVFFGEGLSDEFHNSMTIDKNQCDLLIVIGSSLKVRPVALIPTSIPENIPQILINREPLNHFNFDVELLGDCDVIIKHLCKRLGNDWLDYCFSETSSEQEFLQNGEMGKDHEFVPPSRYIFKGAELNDSYDSDEGDDDDNEDEDEENYDDSDSIEEVVQEKVNESDELIIKNINLLDHQHLKNDQSDLFSQELTQNSTTIDKSCVLYTNNDNCPRVVSNEKAFQELKIKKNENKNECLNNEI